MSDRAEILQWAQRVIGLKGKAAHYLLNVPETASLEDAQDAFHKVARSAHPDLHRRTMTPEELEQVTTAYALVAGAYQDFRSAASSTQRMKPLKTSDLPGKPGPQGASGRAPGGASPSADAPIKPAPVGKQMSGRALIYYRKAELALKRGDLKGALLQVKMAIAADPKSAFLRSALAEIELEVRKP